MHTLTSRMTIWSAGYKVRSITPLEDEKAMTEGADFLGESIVFLISAGVVVSEYNRSKEKERRIEEEKEREQQEANDALQAKLNALDVRLNALEKVVKANSRSILNFGERYVEPEGTVPIDDRRSKKPGDISSKPGEQSREEPGTKGAPARIENLDGKSQVDSSIPEQGKRTPPRSWGWPGWWPF